MQAFPKGDMGLTPDAVKATPEWKAARIEMDRAMTALRNANAAVNVARKTAAAKAKARPVTSKELKAQEAEKKAAKAAKPKKYDPAKKPRGLLEAIARSGGLRRDEFKAEGVDPAEFSRRIGIRYLFRANGGMGMDRLQEWMQQEHYLPRDPEDGKPIVDRNDVLDKLFTALAGNEVYADDHPVVIAHDDMFGPSDAPAPKPKGGK